jgi:iron(III) transport system permease protein
MRLCQPYLIWPLLALFLLPLGVVMVQGMMGMSLSVFALDPFLSTALLMFMTAFMSGLMGGGMAWIQACYDYPGRRVLGGMLWLPLSVPNYLLAVVWVGVTRDTVIGEGLHSLLGTAVILSLASYPYSYGLTRAWLKTQGQSVFDSGRLLGLNHWQLFIRLGLPTLKTPMILGGIWAALESLDAYGVVLYMGTDTFIRRIYASWYADGEPNAALSYGVVMLVVAWFLLKLEAHYRQKQAFFSNARALNPIIPKQTRYGWAFSICALLPVLSGFLIPLGYFIHYSEIDALQNTALLQAVLTTVVLVGAVVGLGLLMSLLVLYGITNSAMRRWLQMGYGVPGLVLGLSALSLSWLPIYVALTWCLLIRFMPLGLSALERSVLQQNPLWQDSAATLGVTGVRRFFALDLPLLKPALWSGGLLMVMDLAKELPISMTLQPFNFETLAIMSYRYASDERLEAAAWPALLLMAILVLCLVLVNAIQQTKRK